MNNIYFAHFVTGFFNLKSVLSKYFSIFIFFLILIPSQVKAEGSKEIWIGDDKQYLLLCTDFIGHCNNGLGDRTQFAIYDCDSLDRLYFDIISTDEIVYLGFDHNNSFDVVYRIKNINGDIVKLEASLPTSGIGNINSIDKARVGPQQIYGALGYNALGWTPPDVGTYYIEFDAPSNPIAAFTIQLFDITVADNSTNTALPGRLYCHAWQFAYQQNWPGPSSTCSGKYYVYSTDSIVTSLKTNQMNGGYWFLYCNQTGVGTSGDFEQDRKSVPNTQVYLPEYRIFLNEPDAILYPPAETLGSILSVTATRYCNSGNIDFVVDVDKTANVEIELDFDNLYVTRTLSRVVEEGLNTLIWNGLDGTTPTGIPVPNGIEIDFTVSYINGLTNLPLYDIESNNNGFVIELVSPEPDPSDTLYVYWDDSNINSGGGGVNLTGCYGEESPWSGCHAFGDGNIHTINTWWYAASENTLPVNITEFRRADSLLYNQSLPQIYCAGEPGVVFSVTPDPNTDIYYWSYTGTGATFVPPNPTGSSVTVDFDLLATPGNIEVYGTNTNCPSPGPISPLPITISPIPIESFTITPNDTSCVDELVTFTATNNTNITDWDWNFGDASSGNGQVVTHTYASAGDKLVTLIVTSADGCKETIDTNRFIFNPYNLDFTINQTPTSTSDIVYFNGVGTATFTDWIWDFGDGSGTDVGHDVDYLYSTPNTYTVSLNVCSATFQHDVIVNLSAACDAGSDESVCERTPWYFSKSTTFPTASSYDSIHWIGGLGSFNDIKILWPIYTPAAGELGPITLTLVAYSQLPNDSSSMTFTVLDAPEVGFTRNPNGSISVNEVIAFDGTSTTTINSWIWDYDDGNGDAGQNVTHPYANEGTYNVKLLVTNTDGCTDSITHQHEVNILPIADFTISPGNTICAELPLTFTDVSTTNVISREWDFDDGSALGSGAVISHTYTISGNYTVTLIIENDNSFRDTVSYNITVFELPTADFTISPNDSSCMNEVINFDATGSSNIIDWQWEFDDGNLGSGKNVTHSYATTGQKQILLIYTNDNGCIDTTIHHREIIDLSALDFSISPSPSCLFNTVNFSGIGNATFTDWNWDFDDGNFDLGHDVTHVYTTYDTFDITLSVCSEQVTHQLIVLQPAQANAGSNESICERDTLYFSLSSTLPSAISYESIKWIGGLGTFDDYTILMPKYVPAVGELGQVDLSLVAYGLLPCSNDTSTMTLTIFDSPEVNFTKNPNSSTCVNELIVFDGSSPTTINSWQWDYDDGNNASGQIVNHYYSQAGFYDIQLLVTNADGCTDSITQQHQVFTLPEAGFTISPNDTICSELPLIFTDTSTTNVISREWNFGDGSLLESGQITTHTYAASGDYNVTLIVENDNTCSDTIVKPVHVNVLPIADFTISPQDTSCTNNPISFNAYEISGGITNWIWEFGDGNNSSGQNTTYSYTQQGDYNILLIYTNGNNCTDTVIHQIRIEDLDVSFTRSPSTSCQNYLVDFHGIDYNGNTGFTNCLWDFGDGIGTATKQDVSYTYTQAGTFDVTLNVCSEQIVLPITVNPTCQVFAGPDTATCEDVPYNLSTSIPPPSASGYVLVYWTCKNPNAAFSDPNAIAPIYTPDPDISDYIDTLTMLGIGISPCLNDTDMMILHVVEGAYAFAGSDENTCFNEPFDFASASTVAFATNYDTLYWTGGNGYFIDPNVEVPVYVPGAGEIGPIVLTMVASGNIINCDSIDEMILTIRPDFLTPLYPILCFGDSLFAQGAWRYSSGVFYDTLYSIYGCDSVIETNLFVYPKIDIDFTIVPGDSICLGETAYYTMTGTANLTNWLWDFGDGTTSSVQNSDHEYLNAGGYDVWFYYTDNHNCSDSVMHHVTVFELPDVNFYLSTTTSCVNTPIDFYGSSTSNIVLWYWDFGDGQNAVGQNVSHSYSIFGDFPVTLTVTDINGCSNSAIDTIIVVEPPNPDFSYDILVCDTLQFTDFSTAPAGYNIVWRHWDFGDGTDTTNWINPTHVFPGGGIYYVTLTVTAQSGMFSCTNSITKPIVVPYNPTIYFTWDPEPTCLGDTTFFWGTSGSYIENWFWDFGDSYFDTIQQPNHVYNNPGAYNVILYITDTLGCVNTLSQTININDVPDVSFTMSQNPVCGEDTVYFAGQSSSQIALWHWDFGDGTYSNVQNDYHIYSSNGTYVVTLTITDTAGCSNTEIDSVLILSTPIADFGYSLFQCTTIDFTDISTIPVNYSSVEWYWDFGNGNYDTLQNPQHTYATGGVYWVTMAVTIDSSGLQCTDTIAQSVLVPDLPTIYFTWSPELTCLGDTTYFFGTSSDSISAWFWNFGDGNFSNVQNPAYVFYSSGSHIVTLSVTDTAGCTNLLAQTVNILEIPDVSFTMSSNPSCVNNPINFYGQSSSVITSWNWDFGDGSFSFIQNPLHIYLGDGTYYVSLTVTDTSGCTNTDMQFIIISDNPDADFTFSVYQCSEMSFTDLSTAPPGYNIASHFWDFGDGATSTEPNPIHNYAIGGFYNVTMVVTADSSTYSCSDSVEHLITVPNAPSVYFTWAPEPTCLGDTTYFFGTSGDSISAWFWDFGDGYNASGENTTHVYSNTGSYNVILIVNDSLGCPSSISHVVTVTEIPDVSFSMSPNPNCVDNIINYTGQSTFGIEFWDWDFGDGTYSILQNPLHSYTASGSYYIILTVTDSAGCSNSDTQYVIITDPPVADFTYSELLCTTISFTDLSTVPAGNILVEWYWDFGDNNTSTTQNPIHDFNVGGFYDVSMIVTSQSGYGNYCYDSITYTVLVPNNPSVFFSWSPEPTYLSYVTSFFGTSGDIIDTWYWDFGDGFFATVQNPTHIFAYTGIFNVSLTVTDINGCENIVSHDVTVVGNPDISMTVNPNPTCIDQEINFSGNSTTQIETWHWVFGDGSYSNLQNPVHVYTEEGTYTVTLDITDIYGGTSSAIEYVVIRPRPVPFFEDSAPVCLNELTYFTDLSYTEYGYITTWIWNYDDGSDNDTIYYPDIPNTSHLFPMEGTYGITLTVISSLGCDESFTREIQIYPNPIANYTYSNACQNMLVNFTDASSPNGPGNIISWFWRFDDPLSGTANTSELQNPSHIFTEAGDYDVMLIIENFNQCFDTLINTVTVNPEPDVEYYWDLTCENQLTHFFIDTDITNMATITDHVWDFGDGQTSFAQDPEHLYVVPGEYTVILTVTDIEGCENSVSHIIDVHPTPVVGFSYSSPACQNSDIQFNDNTSTASGYVVQWIWDMGDGTTITIDYPDSPDITYTYATSGTFQVDLWVITTDSCENSASQNVIIADSPLADFEFEDACGDQPIQFTDNSTAVGGYAISQWAWDFGDPASGNNNYSSTQNPIHSFSQTGAYDVSLIVFNSEGCSDTLIQQVVSAELPLVDFITSTPTCFDDFTYFYADSILMDIGSIVIFEWNFGDGSPTSNQQNPVYMYLTTGDFNVTLSVVDTGGCENSISHIVTISPRPQAIFDYTNACQSDTTYFTDYSSSGNDDPITEWTWDFGDPTSGSNTSVLQNPIHVYENIGTYQVQLVVTCLSGCTDSLSREVIVNPLPTANFNYSVDACQSGLVYFTDSSYAFQTSIAEWFWTFEPGYNSSLRNPIHDYYTVDTCYEVSLMVTDGRGCQQTFIDTVCIPAGLEFDFTYSPTCFGQTTSFFPEIISPQGDTLVTYNWNFGDLASGINNTSNVELPSHNFTSPGAYTVSLEAMDQFGCSLIIYKQITVELLPIPDFTYESNICDSLVYFDDLSDGNGTPIQSWTWIFGDGTPNETIVAPANPDIPHAYSNPGFYDVSLVVLNTNGCQDTISKEIFREYCIRADFAVLDTLLCQNFILNFSDSSIYSDVISQWYWDFGDGFDTTYIEHCPVITHAFILPGTFDIRLIVYSNIGAETISDTIIKSIIVLPSPIADFSCNAVCFNEISYFNDISNTNGTELISWLWNFNYPDSVYSSNEQNPWYQYNIADSFDVKLYITAENACYDSIIKTVAVNPLPVADFEWINACMSKSTNFTDISDGINGIITNWGWNFGDSLTRKDTSSFANPYYIYDSTGAYDVRLIVSNEHTCIDTSIQAVTVYPVPYSNFSFVENYNNVQGQLQFTNETQGGVDYFWLFGDGGDSEETDPQYQYDADGNYIIELISWNEYDCPDTMSFIYQFLFKGLFVPNAFSPDNPTSEVRVFQPKGVNLLQYDIKIYDSWGHLLWQSQELDATGCPSESWDGMYNGELMPMDVYLWRIKATFVDGSVWEGKSVGNNENGALETTGTVTLIR